MGSGAKSYMSKGFLIYEEMRKYFPIYEEAVSRIWLCTRSLWISLYTVWGKFSFLFYQCRGSKPRNEIEHLRTGEGGGLLIVINYDRSDRNSRSSCRGHMCRGWVGEGGRVGFRPLSLSPKDKDGLCTGRNCPYFVFNIFTSCIKIGHDIYSCLVVFTLQCAGGGVLNIVSHKKIFLQRVLFNYTLHMFLFYHLRGGGRRGGGYGYILYRSDYWI